MRAAGSRRLLQVVLLSPLLSLTPITLNELVRYLVLIRRWWELLQDGGAVRRQQKQRPAHQPQRCGNHSPRQSAPREQEDRLRQIQDSQPAGDRHGQASAIATFSVKTDTRRGQRQAAYDRQGHRQRQRGG